MLNTPQQLTLGAAIAGLLAAASWPALAAPPADWSRIPTKTVTLFYPGQSGYGWLRSRDHRRADRKVKRGDSCVSCHEGEEAEMGQRIVTGERLEPTPIKGKNGSLKLKVQVAQDGTNIYWRFQWPTQMNRAGQMHNYMVYDGAKWKFMGGPRSSAKVRSGAEPPLYEDRLSIMLDDGSVPRFKAQGCWLTCHSGMRDMPNVATKAQVSGHPRLGKGGLKKHDVRKYLPGSRTDEDASWDKVKSADAVAKLKAEGKFLDLMQWRAHRSNPVGMADDGYVLEYRLFDKGKKPFGWNVDKKTMTPKFMFDAKKVGAKSITVADIGNPSKPYAIIKEENAVAYDPNAGWKKGDVLPGRLLTRTGTEGSAGDNKHANGVWKNGIWTLTWSRPLDTGHPGDDKILKVGGVYNVSFAVHDDNVTTRHHFVSFPMTLGIGAKAALEAVKAD
ncbi:MAG: ethylbenzene dehydrogenase-related protein [Rhodospirillales bacterium]